MADHSYIFILQPVLLQQLQVCFLQFFSVFSQLLFSALKLLCNRYSKKSRNEDGGCEDKRYCGYVCGIFMDAYMKKAFYGMVLYDTKIFRYEKSCQPGYSSLFRGGGYR